MTEAEAKQIVTQAAMGHGLDEDTLATLSSQLVWRIGRLHDDEAVVIRVGFASSAQLFSDLPKLKSANDYEVEQALSTGDVRIEWVGQRS